VRLKTIARKTPAAASGHGRRGGVQRDAHRLVRVFAARQLLAVAGHEQERVVGGGAEHEDGCGAGRLAGDREARLPEQVLRAARCALGQQHREERDQPEDRRAVDEHEQYQDDRRGPDQQHAVDAAEDVRHVGGEARAASHVRLQPVLLERREPLAQRLDRRHELILADAGERNHGHGYRTVVRHLGR
jgi:hypothetical protein